MNAGSRPPTTASSTATGKSPATWPAAAASSAIGDAAITAGGNANGQVDAGNWREASALWMHLTRARLLQGSYDGGARSARRYRVVTVAPQNAFNGYMLLGQTRDYSTAGGAPNATQPVRLGLVLGDNIPVDIARELDLKSRRSAPSHRGAAFHRNDPRSHTRG